MRKDEDDDYLPEEDYRDDLGQDNHVENASAQEAAAIQSITMHPAIEEATLDPAIREFLGVEDSGQQQQQHVQAVVSQADPMQQQQHMQVVVSQADPMQQQHVEVVVSQADPIHQQQHVQAVVSQVDPVQQQQTYTTQGQITTQYVATTDTGTSSQIAAQTARVTSYDNVQTGQTPTVNATAIVASINQPPTAAADNNIAAAPQQAKFPPPCLRSQNQTFEQRRFSALKKLEEITNFLKSVNSQTNKTRLLDDLDSNPVLNVIIPQAGIPMLKRCSYDSSRPSMKAKEKRKQKRMEKERAAAAAAVATAAAVGNIPVGETQQ